jgi:hypothetical protein
METGTALKNGKSKLAEAKKRKGKNSDDLILPYATNGLTFFSSSL